MQQHGWTWKVLCLVKYVKQRKTNTVCYHLYVDSKIKLVNIIKNKLSDRYREQTSGYQWGKERGEGKIGVGD